MWRAPVRKRGVMVVRVNSLRISVLVLRVRWIRTRRRIDFIRGRMPIIEVRVGKAG